MRSTSDQQISLILDGCQRHHVVPGIHCVVPVTAKRHQQGFRMITVTSDHSSVISATRADATKAREAVTGGTAPSDGAAPPRAPYSA